MTLEPDLNPNVPVEWVTLPNKLYSKDDAFFEFRLTNNTGKAIDGVLYIIDGLTLDNAPTIGVGETGTVAFSLTPRSLERIFDSFGEKTIAVGISGPGELIEGTTEYVEGTKEKPAPDPNLVEITQCSASYDGDEIVSLDYTVKNDNDVPASIRVRFNMEVQDYLLNNTVGANTETRFQQEVVLFEKPPGGSYEVTLSLEVTNK